MRVTRRIVGVVAAASLASTPAWTQGAEELFDPGQYYIEGVRTYCPEVETLVRTRAPELVQTPDAFTIIINGPAFDALAPGIRLFVYYQTCANMAYHDAALADAYAARLGVTQRWLAAIDIETICQTDLLVQAGWTAVPDAQRCMAIYLTMRDALQ